MESRGPLETIWFIRYLAPNIPGTVQMISSSLILKLRNDSTYILGTSVVKRDSLPHVV